MPAFHFIIHLKISVTDILLLFVLCIEYDILMWGTNGHNSAIRNTQMWTGSLCSCHFTFPQTL